MSDPSGWREVAGIPVPGGNTETEVYLLGKLLHKRTSVQNKGTSVIANRIPIDYPMHDVSVYVVSQS